MKEMIIVASMVVFAVGLMVGSVGCLTERANYITATAKIEQLRSDIQRVSAQRSEDAVGQVTQWNQRIAAKKRWNKVPFLNLWIPDGWESIDAIEIPE